MPRTRVARKTKGRCKSRRSSLRGQSKNEEEVENGALQ